MFLEHLSLSPSGLPWVQIVLGALAVWLIKNYFHQGLNKYPGPPLAALTDWWRFYIVARRKAQFAYLKLHNELGDVVRLGPGTLSFSDPLAAKTIYGLHNKLNKVRSC